MREFDSLVMTGLLNGAIGMLILLVLYSVGWAWARRSSTTPGGVQVNEPPDALSPAAIRYIYTLGKGDMFTGLAADLVNIATRGYLRIEEEGGLYRIVSNQADRSALTSEESSVVDALLGRNESLTFLPHTPRKEIMGALRSLTSQFGYAYGRAYFPKSSLMSIASWLIAAIFTALVVYPLWSLGLDTFFVAIAWLTFSGVAILVWALAIYSYADIRRRRRSGGPSLDTDRIRILVPIVLALGFTGFSALLYFVALPGADLPWLLLPILLLWASRPALGNRIRSVTPSGREVLRQIDGFRKYLLGEGNTTHVETTDLLHFERYLPYAIALGVAVEWADRFRWEYTPSWYIGTKYAVSTPVDLASVISTSLANAIYIAAAPRDVPVGAPS